MKCKHHGPAKPGVWACPTCLVELREENQRLIAALQELMECPYDIDAATVPKAGIDAAPEQVVGVMSVALVRMRRARALLLSVK